MFFSFIVYEGMTETPLGVFLTVYITGTSLDVFIVVFKTHKYFLILIFRGTWGSYINWKGVRRVIVVDLFIVWSYVCVLLRCLSSILFRAVVKNEHQNYYAELNYTAYDVWLLSVYECCRKFCVFIFNHWIVVVDEIIWLLVKRVLLRCHHLQWLFRFSSVK